MTCGNEAQRQAFVDVQYMVLLYKFRYCLRGKALTCFGVTVRRWRLGKKELGGAGREE